jgi:hypothetical protein
MFVGRSSARRQCSTRWDPSPGFDSRFDLGSGVIVRGLSLVRIAEFLSVRIREFLVLCRTDPGIELRFLHPLADELLRDN